MKIADKEIAAASSLEPFKRYQYLIKRIADSEKLYSLTSLDGDLAISKVKQNFLLPLWPAEEFADLGKTDSWSQFKLIEISLSDFERIYIPLIKERGYLLNLFPANNRTGFVVSLDEFIRDLNDELEQYS